MNKQNSLNEPSLKETLFITAFPKSGSSFLSLVLERLLEYKPVNLVYSHFGEQDLYLPFLKQHQGQHTISKHHTLGTIPNLDLCKDYNIAPVVLTRNLEDVIVSLRDHVLKTMRWPHFNLPSNFKNLEVSEQFDFLIDNAIPWYIHFYSSWTYAKSSAEIAVEFVRYEDFVADNEKVVQQVLRFWGFQVNNSKINEIIKEVHGLPSDKNRVNQARSGRGKEQLSPSQIQRIHSFLRYYPDIDFTPIK